MRDIESLYEIMAEDDDWMTQLDAAEGLVKLGDERGLEFLLSAQQGDDAEISDVVQEILDSPAVKRMREKLEEEERQAFKEKVQSAKTRLQKGRKVFLYKMVFLPTGDILNEDPMGEGFDVPALGEFGLEGWEVVSSIPRRRQVLTASVDDHLTGIYFLLKKEVHADEASELDNV